MGRLLQYHIVFEESTQGQPRNELYKQAKKRLEKKLMTAQHEGNISFMPLGIKRLNYEADDKEIHNEDQRIYYKGELEENGFMVTDKEGRRFPKKERQ